MTSEQAREQNIKNYTDARTAGIAISSACRDSAMVASALLSSGAINEGEFIATQKRWYQYYLNLYVLEQERALTTYNTIASSVKKDAHKEQQEQYIEFDCDLQAEEGQ